MVLIAALSLVAVVAGCLGRSGPAPVPLRLGWVLSPASNTVTIQVTSPAGTAGEQVLARSQMAVSEDGGGPPATGPRPARRSGCRCPRAPGPPWWSSSPARSS